MATNDKFKADVSHEIFQHSSFSSSPGKYIAWYLGIQNVTQQIEAIINTNLHYALIEEDEEENNTDLKLKIDKYLDLNRLDAKYRSHEYYLDYNLKKKYYYPMDKLKDEHLLRTDLNLANLLKKLYLPEVSPLLADDLTRLPKTYLAVCEWDTLRDEGLLYAQRLKESGIHVHVDFYEDAYKGI